MPDTKLLYTHTCKQKDSSHGKINNRENKLRQKTFNTEKSMLLLKRHNHKDISNYTSNNIMSRHTKQTRNKRI